jgi:hypothetical protein
MCEPLEDLIKHPSAAGRQNVWTVILNDQKQVLILDVTGGSSLATSTRMCSTGAAACTLIGRDDHGNDVQIIVFTQKALVSGGTDATSRATVLDFKNAGELENAMSVDKLTHSSLLSFYMTHELFHTLSTPENLALAGMFNSILTLLCP